jgi:hypothetical protein
LKITLGEIFSSFKDVLMKKKEFQSRNCLKKDPLFPHHLVTIVKKKVKAKGLKRILEEL